MAIKVNGFTRYTVRKNCHFFFPLQLGYFKSSFEKLIWQGWFTDSCRYDLKSNDQKDWNKGGGISHDFFTNKKNSLRWAWRYNKETGLIELAGYAYVNGERKLSDFVFTVAIDQEFTVTMSRSDQKAWILEFSKVDGDGYSGVAWEVPFGSISKRVRREGLYFGGNRKAPNRMHVFLKFERQK